MTVLVLIIVTLLFGAIIIWFRKRYGTSQERKMHFLMRGYLMCRSVVKSKNLPLLSGKRALYTIHPIEQLEMNQLDKRDFSKADVPQQSSAQAHNAQTFMTAMPECKPLLLDCYVFLCVVLSVDAARMGLIPVKEFEQHCINQHKCRDAGFEAEYEVCLQRNAHYIKIIIGFHNWC